MLTELESVIVSFMYELLSFVLLIELLSKVELLSSSSLSICCTPIVKSLVSSKFDDILKLVVLITELFITLLSE